jgi:fumarylacetoacetase
MDATHDPRRRSFVEVPRDSDFPIQNLPFGAFRPRAGGSGRVGVRIGDFVLDLAGVAEQGWLDGCRHLERDVFAAPALNGFLSLGRPAWREARAAVSDLLSGEDLHLQDDAALRERLLLPLAEVEMRVPAAIGDYTDFYSSLDHAVNVGTLIRGKDNALMPNWRHLPVAYHGRASSIIASGAQVRRPLGQTRPGEGLPPRFGPSQVLDFELEMGFLVGPGNPLGQPIRIQDAEAHIFGLVLVNDWSARDIQKWEYQPLGPFLSKSFATSVSPWVVTLEALEPFRRPQPVQDPPPLPYLRSAEDCAYDVALEVRLQTAQSAEPAVIARSNLRHLYWTMRQQLAHHTVGGCNLQPGDLVASGTISGPDPSERGCLLELTWGWTQPLQLPGGVTRQSLEDGDTVTLSGRCANADYAIGFGECSGTVLPALEYGSCR